MKFAYADPPYIDLCAKYDHVHGPILEGLCWDDIDTHRQFIGDYLSQFDGWALSLSSSHLYRILPLCPPTARVAPWCKSFASFKPNVNPAYVWEPVIFFGARKASERTHNVTVRDYHIGRTAMRRGLFGAKPEDFCAWVAQLLGVEDEDDFVDIFPGTGVMSKTMSQGVLL